MALKDNASLALIPAAYKTSKVYSALPTDGDGDFTFSRTGSATRVNKAGLIETMASNEPRLDYPLLDGVVQDCPALLLEPSRTNYIPYSEDFNDASWLKTNLNITKDIETAPNGLLNASKILQTSSGGYARINATFIGNETFSMFVKKGDLTDFKLFLGGNAVYFDLENGTILSEAGSSLESSKIESFNDDWYRCSITSSYSGSSSIRFQGTDGTNDNSLGFIYTYGAQLEQGSYPTSYIKTQGATVTRSADVCNGAGTANDFNDSEGVLMVETKGENDGTFNYISISDGGTQNYAGILYTDEDNQITYRYYVGGSGVQLIIDDIVVTNFNKVAVKWKINDFAIWINGFELGTATSGSLNPSGTFNELAFARGGSNNTPFYGNTKEVIVFNEALSDTELQALTSWTSFNEMATEQLYSIE